MRSSISSTLACLALPFVGAAIVLGPIGCSTPNDGNPFNDAGASADGDLGAGNDATSGAGQDTGSTYGSFGSDSGTGEGGIDCNNPLDRQGCACPQGSAPRSCYTGTASQAGVGLCKMGTQTCDNQSEVGGRWGACMGSGAPTTCSAADTQCGTVSDGCGGVLSCGTCTGGLICSPREGGAGNACGMAPCKPKTCADLGDSCGQASDGCGGTLTCGTCPTGQSCGGAGTPNQCGCTPKTCAGLGDDCGSASDGCGGTLSCGKCPTGQQCGAGGVPNQCGCAPKTCSELGDNCGTVSDGCGGTLSCGKCPNGEQCGAGGVPNHCACVPKTCAELGDSCGSASDGCGGTLDCGTCPTGQQCGGGGVPNQCGCGTGCCASQKVAFVDCGPTAGTMKPGAFDVTSVACSSVATATALIAYDTIVYVGPMSPLANADFPAAVSARLMAGAKVLFIPTGTCDGSPGCGFGAANWQTVYSDLYLEDNMEYSDTIGTSTVSIPNPNTMTAAFSATTYASYDLGHLMFDGSLATQYLDYPGGTLSGTFSWCSDLVATGAGGTKSDPFHAYLLDSGTRKGLLIVTTLDYAHATNTFDFSEPFLAAHLSLPWDQAGNSAACGLACNSTTPWVPPVGIAKPVIYLYPTKDQDVYVRLDLSGKLARTYPEYDTAIHGWKVRARHDGELWDSRDGQEYSYLYWAGESTAFQPTFDEGFIVEGKNSRQFLQSKLAKMGMLPREYNEMIVYWLPYMESHPYNLVTFAGASYTDVAKLTITPRPDSMLRVFMVFKKLDAPVAIKPQTIEPFRRKGFTVVEWGGAEVGDDRHAIQ